MCRVCYITVLALCLTTALTSLPCTVQAQQTGQTDAEYTPEQITSTPAEVFLERLANPEPGYQQFAAMHALERKGKESNSETRMGILSLVVRVMTDTSRNQYQRWQCCYVISGIGDERGVQPLIDVLFKDPSVIVRSVAAEALANFKNNAAAHAALVQASKQESNQQVLEVINKRLVEGEAQYSLEDIKNTPAETFLERMLKPEPGYEKFAAMHALGRKAKESDPETRAALLKLIVTVMNDKSRDETQRWECCYAISDCGDEQGIPYLAEVLMNDPLAKIRAVAAEALGYFKNSAAAKDALRQAAQQEKSQTVLDVINKYLNAGTAEYTQEQIEATSAETFLDRLQTTEPGYGEFAALHALAKKAKNSDAKARWTILSMVVNAMNDKSRTERQRFQCCYVISDCGDAGWVPCLIYVLVNDPSATMRSVAAEALAKFPNSTKAHDALVQAARRETDQKVLDVLNRVLGKTASGS